MGTDAVGSVPGRNLEELQLMHSAGQMPADVLRSTTQVGAQLLGVDEHYGTLQPGKRADIVLVSGDPYDFDDLQARVDAVWMDGVQVEDRAAR